MERSAATNRGWADRAVSPVIGVILMVAITVILAAVIGAFVLEIGDQQETAPTATFSFDQEVRYYSAFGSTTNLTTLLVTHSGGDTVDIAQLNIKVDGNASVWGPTGESTAAGPLYRPQPDHFESATTNEPVTVGSGDQWTINGYNGWSDEAVKNQKIVPPYYGYYFEGLPSYPDGCKASGERGVFTNPSVKLSETSSGGAIDDRCTDRLATGDELRAVWRAESGGKTQTLTKYEIQADGAPESNQ